MMFRKAMMMVLSTTILATKELGVLATAIGHLTTLRIGIATNIRVADLREARVRLCYITPLRSYYNTTANRIFQSI